MCFAKLPLNELKLKLSREEYKSKPPHLINLYISRKTPLSLPFKIIILLESLMDSFLSNLIPHPHFLSSFYMTRIYVL